MGLQGFLVKVINVLGKEADYGFLLEARQLFGNKLTFFTEKTYEKEDVLFVYGDFEIQQVNKDLWEEPLKIGTYLRNDNDYMMISYNNEVYKILNKEKLSPIERDLIVFTFDEGCLEIIDPRPDTDMQDGNIDSTSYIFDVENIKETFDNYGGNKEVIKKIRELIEVSIKKKDLLDAIGVAHVKGVLFTGPPGTGKTMMARIVAKESDSTFYHISGPEIINKYVGESERVLRAVFEDAKNKKQAIIFFDEIDSIAIKRDENSHESSKKLVAQLLTLMDGFESKDNVLVIATTNRIQDIDPALKRPGRFDQKIHFEAPETLIDRVDVLIKSGMKIQKNENLPYNKIAEKSEGWSSAELSSIWTFAGVFAAKDNRTRIFKEDFWAAFKQLENELKKKE